MLKRSRSTNEDVDLKAQEYEDFETNFKAELQLYLKRKRESVLLTLVAMFTTVSA